MSACDKAASLMATSSPVHHIPTCIREHKQRLLVVCGKIRSTVSQLYAEEHDMLVCLRHETRLFEYQLTSKPFDLKHSSFQLDQFSNDFIKSFSCSSVNVNGPRLQSLC